MTRQDRIDQAVVELIEVIEKICLELKQNSSDFARENQRESIATESRRKGRDNET